MRGVLCVVIKWMVLLNVLTLGFILNNGEVDESIQQYLLVKVKQRNTGRGRRELLDTLSTMSNNQKGHQDRVTFEIDGFGNKRWTLNLALNQLLLPDGSKTRFTNQDGADQAFSTRPIDNCYYQGVIEGLEGSSVALSTCQGLEGVIFDGNESFYIQPHVQKADEIASHIIYRTKDVRHSNAFCDQHSYVDYSDLSDLVEKDHRVRRSLESETKYIELVIVNDNSQVKFFKGNLDKTIQRSRTIANIVDSLYRAINVRVALIELIIWNDKDQIHVDEDSSKALENFNGWRNSELIKKRKLKHDNAQLLTHVDFKGPTVGKAHVLAICTSRSAGVVQDHSSDAASTASTFAHEVGHNLGMGHDTEDCKCESKKENQHCIMSGVARSVPATDWSSCSRAQFNNMLDKGLDSCLFNVPKKLYGSPICGNGFKEEGEDCDCGNAEECAKYSDNCCNSTTCKLKPGAECDEGPCCSGCKFKPSHVICRDKVNECDLPEHCTGNSGLCPANRFVYHGKPCKDGKGYCNQGECPTHDGQCQLLWGKTVKSGPELCYTLNTRGSFAGNCLKESKNSFRKCKQEDIYCGTLHCQNTKTDLPLIGTERTAYRYKWHVDGKMIECRSSSVQIGLDSDDPGMAREGTKCGDEKVCMNNKCSNITDLLEKYVKCPGDCSGKGICDSNGKCYCDDCWTGNDCTKSTTCLNAGARVGPSRLAGYIILVFIIIGLIVALVAGFIYREKIKAKWKERKSPSRRYEATHSSSPKQSSKTSDKQPYVTTAPKPKPMAYSTPGKIDLPSWPADSPSDRDINRVPRRPPPGPPSSHRASSPPVSSIRDNPMFNQSRPDSYAGVLDRKPQPSFAANNRITGTHSNADQSTDQSIRPSDVKNNQQTALKPPKPPLPGQRPVRAPPKPPSRPGQARQT